MANIYDSAFENNTALQGGVFNIESGSVIKLHNVSITHNFAVEGGVVWARNDGYFEFYSVTITENYALSLIIGEVFDVPSTSIINNCVISDNYLISKENFFTTNYYIMQ